MRWRTNALVALVRVSDATPDAADRITFVVGDASYVVRRDGGGDVPAQVAESARAGSRAPSSRSPEGRSATSSPFDVQVTDGATTVGWNQQGAMGTLTLVEPLSYTEAVAAPVPPAIDGEIDGVWSLANTVSTDVAVQAPAARRRASGRSGAPTPCTSSPR